MGGVVRAEEGLAVRLHPMLALSRAYIFIHVQLWSTRTTSASTNVTVTVFFEDRVVAQMGATELRAQCFASNLGASSRGRSTASLRGVVNVSDAKGSGIEPDVVSVWHLKQSQK
jgi:hypothetical protein